AWLRDRAREDHQHVGAERGHLCRHLRLRSLANGNRRYHGRHGNDDAERGQEGAKLVLAQRAQSGAEGGDEVHAAPSCSSTRASRRFSMRRSSSTNPSLKVTTRFACCAMSSSCVTSSTV